MFWSKTLNLRLFYENFVNFLASYQNVITAKVPKTACIFKPSPKPNLVSSLNTGFISPINTSVENKRYICRVACKTFEFWSTNIRWECWLTGFAEMCQKFDKSQIFNSSSCLTAGSIQSSISAFTVANTWRPMELKILRFSRVRILIIPK